MGRELIPRKKRIGCLVQSPEPSVISEALRVFAGAATWRGFAGWIWLGVKVQRAVIHARGTTDGMDEAVAHWRLLKEADCDLFAEPTCEALDQGEKTLLFDRMISREELLLEMQRSDSVMVF